MIHFCEVTTRKSQIKNAENLFDVSQVVISKTFMKMANISFKKQLSKNANFSLN